MKNKGFTLIEVIVSVVILAVGVIAMINLFPAASTVNAKADRVNQASILAEDKIEYFRSMGYDSLQHLINAGQSTGNYKAENITVNWTLTTVGNLIQINVVCNWPPPGRVTVAQTSSINLVTQIAQHE